MFTCPNFALRLSVDWKMTLTMPRFESVWKLGGNLGLEIALLLEKAYESLPILLDSGGVVRSLRGVVGYLNQPRVGIAFGSRELKNAVVHSRFEDEEHAETLGLRLHLDADVLELTCCPERRGRKLGPFHGQRVRPLSGPNLTRTGRYSGRGDRRFRP